MKTQIKRIFIIALLIASVFAIGALALSESDPLLHADLSRADFSFNYTPFANSEYALYILSADGGAVQGRAQLFENGEMIAEGEGFGEILSARLVAGREYNVRVHGSGQAVIELARKTLSRCMGQALAIGENASQGKMIAREFDAHWYSFRAEASSLLMLTGVPEDRNLSLNAWLFDDAGALVAEFDNLSGGACMLLAQTEAGREYYVRVCASAGGTGYYLLSLNRAEGMDIGSALGFDSEGYSLAVGERADLSAEVSGRALLWVSEDNTVVAVSQTGEVVALAEGETKITAYGLNGSAECRVRVEHVALESIALAETEISIPAGETQRIAVRFTPENASDRRLRYVAADRSIVTVDKAGEITALAEGETSIAVRTSDGRLEQSLRVIVTPAQKKYRALLVGEQSYPFAENSERKGSATSVQAIAALLESVEFDGAGLSLSTRADLSRAELIAAIRSAFSGAREQDVSLLYITCHGKYQGGMSFLELSDGSSFSARDLERELRAVPGTIIVMIDCCGSGGVIGRASDRLAFARGVTGAFSGAAIRGSKYKVLASAALDEDSFRIAFNEEASAGVMATVFARALCDGAGWSIDRNSRTAMGADFDYDGSVTLDELFIYMQGRVNWYMEIASRLSGENYRQSVQVYPEGDPFILFERKDNS